ncbi:MAG: recombinase family protein, partial [Bacteroidales bacterium]
MKTKAVIYARVSTDRQKTKVQIEELREYAKLNNFEVVREFDETISGYVKDRDELSALKVFVKENNIKQILCFELSR